MKRASLILLLLFLAVLPVGIRAQEGGGYDLSWNTIGGGGGVSSGGNYELYVLLAQPEAGQAAGGEYTLSGGLLGGGDDVTPAGEPELYLPFVKR